MTKEEIRIQTIAQLERISGMLGSMGEKKDWTEYAIRALEQEPILDKIRAKIKDWQTDIHDNEYDADKYDFVFERIFKIIDEYKEESEE